MQPEPKMTNWRRGKPSRVGEYIASVCRDMRLRRWWNGKHWSLPYAEDRPERIKRRARRTIGQSQNDIEWRGLVEKPFYPFPPPEQLEKNNE